MFDNSPLEADGRAAAARHSAWEFFQPYADFDVDFLYNALFCDSVSLFRREPAPAADAESAPVLADPPCERALMHLAADASAPSRVRALACHRLRAAGHDVSRELLLGVIVELPHAHSQETLAAFSDGRVHFIRHSGATAQFDSAADAVAERARKLVAAAQRLVNRFTTPEARRHAPPSGGDIRITLLTGAGAFRVEGRFNALQKDPLAGAVLGNAIWLLQAHALLEAGR